MYPNNFKLGGVLGLSFEVSKILELMKPLLYSNHDNHLTTNCFFASYCKKVVKITQFQILAEITIFNFKTLEIVR